jgi:UDP-2,4-diacetamido-2,4,6-trideoxy-beta-L-altropyranose hydrolase
MLNIYILTEGGANIGMGHISRCQSLSDAFAQYGYESTLIINASETAIKNLSYQKVIQLDWINEESKVLSIVKNSDLLIIDSYLCDKALLKKLSLESCLTGYIDDNLRLDYPDGVIINGVMCAETMAYPQKRNYDCLLGQNYSFLRKEFWDVPEKFINEKVRSVMVTCGGADDGGLSYSVLKFLVEHYPLLEKTVILKDLNTPYLNYFEQHSCTLTNLTALEMRSAMIDSDITITASGQTTYELCRTGTPFIAITTSENQLFSINSFYEKGLVYTPISGDDIDFIPKLADQFKALLDCVNRQSVHEKMKKNISGKGSLNVVKQLIKILNNKFINNDTRRNKTGCFTDL